MYYEAVWFKLKAASTFHVFPFSFLFPCAWTVTSHGFTVQGTKITVHALFITVHSTVYVLKNIKNESHGTIHTFKNYFATIFSVFSFSKNKLYPNEPKHFRIFIVLVVYHEKITKQNKRASCKKNKKQDRSPHCMSKIDEVLE